MSRARDIGLYTAIALSILSASSLSGAQSGDAFSFLGALRVKSLPFATAETHHAEISTPAATVVKPKIFRSIKPVHAGANQRISLVERRQAFIASVVRDLSSKGPKNELVLALKGET